MSNLIWGRVPAGLLWIPWWFPGAGWWVECVDSVGRGRQVEAVKYKKGQANYATKFLTRNIESKTGSVRVGWGLQKGVSCHDKIDLLVFRILSDVPKPVAPFSQNRRQQQAPDSQDQG